MTVSRALSGSPQVREETRKTIVQRAAELGYVKSAAATAIRGDAAGIIGLLLPTLVNEFYARFADNLAQKCEAAGLQLIIHLTGDHLERERSSLLKLREVQAAAVVMVPVPGSLAVEENLPGDMQVIQLIRTGTQKSITYSAIVDDRMAIIQAIRGLAEMGHRRIAYLGGSTSLSSGKARLKAFTTGLQAMGIDPLSGLLHTDAPSFSMGYETTLGLIEQNRPTALLCGGFEISNGALNALLDRGLRLPEQISFVGYGDPSYYRWLEGGISTISVPVELLASETAELIVTAKTHLESAPDQRSVEAEFVIRHSCKPLE